jgi:hypothetical protein
MQGKNMWLLNKKVLQTQMCVFAKAITLFFNLNGSDICDESTQGPLVVVKRLDKTIILSMNMEVELLKFF